MTFVDSKGTKWFVTTGLWNRSQFGTFRRSESGGLHRHKTQALPMRDSEPEAEADLAAYAAAHGWKAAADEARQGKPQEWPFPGPEAGL